MRQGLRLWPIQVYINQAAVVANGYIGFRAKVCPREPAFLPTVDLGKLAARMEGDDRKSCCNRFFDFTTK